MRVYNYSRRRAVACWLVSQSRVSRAGPKEFHLLYKRGDKYIGLTQRLVPPSSSYLVVALFPGEAIEVLNIHYGVDESVDYVRWCW
jgi:hypothetical protein